MSSAQQAQQNNRTGDGKYTTKNHSEADVSLGIGGQPSHHVKQLTDAAYRDRNTVRSDALDELASETGVHVVSAVRHSSTDPQVDGQHTTVDSLAENHPQLPLDIAKAATDAYSNEQDYHFGVGASQADELRSTQFVVPIDSNEQPITDHSKHDQAASWHVVHAYGAHSETEAEDRHETLTKLATRHMAQQFAATDTAGGQESESLGFYNSNGAYDSDAQFWESYENAYYLTERGLDTDVINPEKTPRLA